VGVPPCLACPLSAAPQVVWVQQEHTAPPISQAPGTTVAAATEHLAGRGRAPWPAALASDGVAPTGELNTSDPQLSQQSMEGGCAGASQACAAAARGRGDCMYRVVQGRACDDTGAPGAGSKRPQQLSAPIIAAAAASLPQAQLPATLSHTCRTPEVPRMVPAVKFAEVVASGTQLTPSMTEQSAAIATVTALDMAHAGKAVPRAGSHQFPQHRTQHIELGAAAAPFPGVAGATVGGEYEKADNARIDCSSRYSSIQGRISPSFTAAATCGQGLSALGGHTEAAPQYRAAASATAGNLGASASLGCLLKRSLARYDGWRGEEAAAAHEVVSMQALRRLPSEQQGVSLQQRDNQRLGKNLHLLSPPRVKEVPGAQLLGIGRSDAGGGFTTGPENHRKAAAAAPRDSLVAHSLSWQQKRAQLGAVHNHQDTEQKTYAATESADCVRLANGPSRGPDGTQQSSQLGYLPADAAAPVAATVPETDRVGPRFSAFPGTSEGRSAPSHSLVEQVIRARRARLAQEQTSSNARSSSQRMSSSWQDRLKQWDRERLPAPVGEQAEGNHGGGAVARTSFAAQLSSSVAGGTQQQEKLP
jgi:hypothetical protein